MSSSNSDEKESKLVKAPSVNDNFGKIELLIRKKQRWFWVSFGIFVFVISIYTIFFTDSKKVAKKVASKISMPKAFDSELTEYDLEKEITKPKDKKPAKKIRRKKRVIRYGGPTVISRPLTGDIRPGTMIKAKLITGASDGLVKASITEGLTSNGMEVLPSGSVLIGYGKSQKNRLYISFKQVVFPDGKFTKVNAVAADMKDKIPGIKGSNINHIGGRLAASAGLNFVAGVSDGLKDRTAIQGAVVDRNTLKNAALNGSAVAAIELSKQMLAESKDEPPKIEIDSGLEIYILFGGSS